MYMSYSLHACKTLNDMYDILIHISWPLHCLSPCPPCWRDPSCPTRWREPSTNTSWGRESERDKVRCHRVCYRLCWVQHKSWMLMPVWHSVYKMSTGRELSWWLAKTYPTNNLCCLFLWIVNFGIVPHIQACRNKEYLIFILNKSLIINHQYNLHKQGLLQGWSLN